MHREPGAKHDEDQDRGDRTQPGAPAEQGRDATRPGTWSGPDRRKSQRDWDRWQHEDRRRYDLGAFRG